MTNNAIIGRFAVLSVMITFFCVGSILAQDKSDDSKLFGDWTGESKCVGSNPYCHDEVVVYHISRSKTDQAKVTIVADKIVDSKPEPMYGFDFDYDRKKQTLTAEFKIPRTGGKGIWFYHIDGDKMDGTLTVFPENEIGRRIKITKSKRLNK